MVYLSRKAAVRASAKVVLSFGLLAVIAWLPLTRLAMPLAIMHRRRQKSGFIELYSKCLVANPRQQQFRSDAGMSCRGRR